MSKPKILELKGTVLYENSQGSTGDITLNDSLSKYKYLEVFWRNGSNNRSEKVIVTLNQNINLSLVDFVDKTIWIHTKTIQMTNIKLTVLRYKEYSIKDQDTWIPYGTDVNSISITKVIGYEN